MPLHPTAAAAHSRLNRRAEAAFEFLLCLVLAIVAALALVHWIDLEGITSAAALAAVPRPAALLKRLVRRWRIWTTETKLAYIQDDLAWMAEELDLLPEKQRIYRAHAQQLRVRLALLERQQ